MSLLHRGRLFLQNFGFDLCRLNPSTHPSLRLQRILTHFGTDLVLDVGANEGQYGEILRQEAGYSGSIVSFEPMKLSFSKLQKKTKQDKRWSALNCALGETERTETINISKNSYSSSLLDILPAHLDSAQDSVYVGNEKIMMMCLVFSV